jgi:hypothetical protein
MGIRAFQEQNKLPVTGELDTATLRHSRHPMPRPCRRTPVTTRCRPAAAR